MQLKLSFKVCRLNIFDNGLLGEKLSSMILKNPFQTLVLIILLKVGLNQISFFFLYLFLVACVGGLNVKMWLCPAFLGPLDMGV